MTSYTSGTQLEQPFTQMFKIREANRAATADLNTAKVQVNQTQDAIALKVRQLYYGILVAQLKQQAAAEQVAASQVKLQESVDEVKRGEALDVAVLESNASALDAKQTALVQRLQIHDLTLNLNDLLGLPLNTEAGPGCGYVRNGIHRSLARGMYSYRPGKQSRDPIGKADRNQGQSRPGGCEGCLHP